MSKDDSEQSTSSDVRSKYFTPKADMDESLSDFQEIKKRCAGPKNTAKSKTSKPKKVPKRIRGQKDIRTVLRTKNELESYSKDFDTVCKKAGIDVDSEQLQLAIALSKSLHDTATTSNETSTNSQTVNTQERVNKIRTTLQEYGFKVPEVKIAANTRKHRKHRNNYKLIFMSDSQKKEIVADKYSQVLFQNIAQCSLYNTDVDDSDIPLYRLASNVTYDVLKVTDTFYVDNLIEKSTNSGNLLRDWSEIPGRPVSPKLLEPSNMNFSEIECSQEELDVVLSGSLKSCKHIFRNKSKDLFSDSACKIIIEDNESNLCVGNITDIEKINTSIHENILKLDNNIAVNLLESNSTTKQCRSCSPDIFDDDASSILENSKNSAVQEKPYTSEEHNMVTKTNLETTDLNKCLSIKTAKPHSSVCNVTKRKSNDFMEITECIQIQLKDNLSVVHKTGSQLSQKSNVTKRRSNDFMEITECVGARSQPIQDSIDLTQSPDIIKENSVIDEYETEKEDENIDHKTNSKPETLILTASPKHNEIDLTGSQEAREIDVETSSSVSNMPKEINPAKDVDSMDLTQSSNTSDELPFVSLTAAKSNSSDDTIIVDINDYANINRKPTNLQNQAEVHIDLTQYSGSINEISNQSFFEEYIHNHSGNSDEPKETNSVNIGYEQCVHSKVNLTESPKSKSISSSTNNYEDSTRSNCNEHSFSPLSQSKPGIGKTLASGEHICSTITVEPVPVELHHSNSDNKLSKPRNVDLTRSPIEQSKDNEGNDIDLTQHSDTSEELSQNHSKLDSSKIIVSDICYGKDTKVSTEGCEPLADINSLRYSSLGKIDDVSIDYDDILNIKADSQPSSSKNTSSKSVNCEIADENIQRHSKDTSFVSNCSQTSEIFEISDKELDYSMHQSKLEIPLGNFAFGGISIMDELSSFGKTKKSIDLDNNSVVNSVIEVENEILPTFNTNNNKKVNKCSEISPIKHRRITEIATPQKACSSNMVTVVTPRNSELVIKTNNITPKIDYELMSTPEIHVELDKYGIKPFKRKRAIKLLTHIYNQTHPTIENYADVTDELASPPKRRKLNNGNPITSPCKLMSPRKLLKSPRVVEECDKCKEKNVSKNFPETSKEKDISDNIDNKKIPDFDKGKESSVNKKKNSTRKHKNSSEHQKKSVPEGIEDSTDNINSKNKKNVNGKTTEAPIIRDIECQPEDWVFQKREKAKVHSCRVPLHIAFHNYVSSRRDLREAILCYEPVEIDVIHKDLVVYGHRYDPKDLLKFLDKKCITVKTTDNDARNHKRS